MFRKDRLVKVAALAFLFLALAHIPDGLFRYGFDKNAPAQFVALLVVAVAMTIAILLRPEHFHFHRFLKIGFLGLIAALLVSTAISGNIIGSITGDAGRYAGMLSLLSLVVIAIFHSQLDFRQFHQLIRFYLAIVFLVVLIGLLERFDLIELPGDQGMASTLGNLDFFAAFVGTSLPLYFFRALVAQRSERIILAVVVVINIYALYLAGALQAGVDVVITLVGLIIYFARKWIPRRNLSVNVRTFLGTFAIIIWAEFIFLFPFFGKSIPVLGSDVQVEIRSNFWLSGTRQFFAHPFFGVGPDQYGNNYEQFRTISDSRDYATILSNDAHSASVQTLATLGIAGTLALLFLLAVLVRSLVLMWDYQPAARRQIFIITLYFFVYLTNSFVSPITIPNKYLFWAAAGFVIGQIYRQNADTRKRRDFMLSATLAVIAATSIFVGSNFAIAQYKYLVATDEYGSDNNSRIDYKFSPYIPCTMYFDAQLIMVASQGNDAAEELGRKQVAVSPRCIAARILLAKIFANANDLKSMRKEIYLLTEFAPARADGITLGMTYGKRAGDQALIDIIEANMKRLGLFYLPGTQD